MYNAGITSGELINGVMQEADIVIHIPMESWYRWINAVEQFLYSEILEEVVEVSVNVRDFENNILPLFLIEVPEGADNCIYDDIMRVYADNVELERSSAAAMRVFTNKPTYCTDYAGNLILNPTNNPQKITLYIRIRPQIKTAESSENLAIPPEHLELMASRLRAEAYKLANEDGLAAKWASDYNNYVETFRIWAVGRNQKYGR